MNLVLADTEEFRRIKKKAAKAPQPSTTSGSTAPPLVESEEKRTLGLTIVRGAHIISLSVESPPPQDPAQRLGASAPGGAGTAPPTMAAGPGISKPAGRGMPVGLTGPAAGVGGPGFGGGFGGPPGGPPGFGRGGPGGPRENALPVFFQQCANMFAAGMPQGFPGPPGGGPRKISYSLSIDSLTNQFSQLAFNRLLASKARLGKGEASLLDLAVVDEF